MIFEARFCAFSQFLAARNQSLNPHQCQSPALCVISCYDIRFVVSDWLIETETKLTRESIGMLLENSTNSCDFYQRTAKRFHYPI